MANNPKPVEALLPVELGKGRIPYARGMKAGRWVFATGVLATDFRTGLAPGIVNPRAPLSGRPRYRKEAEAVLERAAEVLAAGGSGLKHAVRTDQFYPSWQAVAHFQEARRAAFGDYIPPSTSILEKSLLLPDAGIEIEVIAVEPGMKIEQLYAQDIETPAHSGFCPVVRCGDFAFIAGFMAAWQPGDRGGIAPEAKLPEGHLWKGTRIKLEAEYLFARKLTPALVAAGSSFDHVVKAWVYLSDIEDIPAFNEIWRQWFPSHPPARIIVPASRPGFAIADARIEVNLVALADNATTRKQVVATDVYTGLDGAATAVRAGDLLFISGLLAADRDGLVPAAEPDARQPYFGSGIEAQMEHLLAAAQNICMAAGTTLANVVRIQQFHTDLREFYPACRVWQRLLPGVPLPVSAIEVPAPLAVPGCSVLLDLWVYAP